MWWAFSAAEAAEAEWLRPAFLAYLRARGLPDDDYNSAELVFGELVSNVVRHAPGPIAVLVRWTGPAPTLSVYDRGPGFAIPSGLPADAMAESGRGLFLVGAFADELRIEQQPDGGSIVNVTLRINLNPDWAPRVQRARSAPDPYWNVHPLPI